MDCCLSGSKEIFVDSDFTGPVTRRRPTDKPFITVKVVFLAILFVLLGYCLAYGDLLRLLNGYDNCGNVCGKYNTKSSGEESSCKGGDFTMKKYLKYYSINVFDIKHTRRECVTNCHQDGYTLVFDKCLPIKKRNTPSFDDSFSSNEMQVYPSQNEQPRELPFVEFFDNFAEDMENFGPRLVFVFPIGCLISFFFLFMIRYAAPFIVWTSLSLIIVVTVGATAFLWFLYSQSSPSESGDFIFLFWSILFSLITLIVILVLIVMRKRIRLVIQLFEEAGKAIISMPSLLIQPVLTFLCLVVLVVLWACFSLMIQSSGKLSQVVDGTMDLNLKESSENFYYRKDLFMKFTTWYNLFAFLWLTQFVISSQHFILAGAVSTWYFTRDKLQLGYPVLRTYFNLLRYHLGSVLLGSLIIALVKAVRLIMKTLERAARRSRLPVLALVFCCFNYIMKRIEHILNLISRNAFVEISIYGNDFFPSAIRALKMLMNNIFSVAAINSIGEFVLFIVKLLITILTFIFSIHFTSDKLLVEQELHYPVLMGALMLILVFIIAHIFISVIEMTIDSLFICFCEDCEMNDGISKPYYMSRGLMQFVENSKKVLKIADAQNVQTPSAPPLERVE